MIERSSLLEYKRRLDCSLTRKTASLKLGVHVRQVNHLVAAKLLKPLCGPGVCGQADWRFDHEQVDTLLNTLFARTRNASDKEVANWIFLQDAVRRARKEKLLLPQLLEAVIDGRLKSKSINEQGGLKCIQVSVKDLDQIKLDQADKHLPDVFSVVRAARVLKIKPDQVRKFIQSGYLKAFTEKFGLHSKYRISRSALEVFRKEYVFPRELSSEIGVTVATFSHLVILAGIAPVSGPGVNSTQYLFARQEVELVKDKLLQSKRAQTLLRSSARTRKRLSERRIPVKPEHQTSDLSFEVANRNSVELRTRIVAAADSGKFLRKEIASHYAVTTEFIRRLLKQRDKEGHLQPKESTRFVSPINKDHVLSIVQDNPRITLQQIVDSLFATDNIQVSITAVSRALIGLGLGRKNVIRKRAGRHKTCNQVTDELQKCLGTVLQIIAWLLSNSTSSLSQRI